MLSTGDPELIRFASEVKHNLDSVRGDLHNSRKLAKLEPVTSQDEVSSRVNELVHAVNALIERLDG